MLAAQADVGTSGQDARAELLDALRRADDHALVSMTTTLRHTPTAYFGEAGQVVHALWIAFLLTGFSNQRWGPHSLPFDLGLIGIPGCSLLVAPDIVTGVPLTGRLSRRVTGLTRIEDAIAADRNRTVVAATVRIDAVAVVAFLSAIHNTVTAHRAVTTAQVAVPSGRLSRRVTGLTRVEDAVAADRK